MGFSKRFWLREELMRSSVWFLATLTLVSGWTPPIRATGAGGMEGTFEYVIDVPWRLEPIPLPGGGFDYGPVPIVITIHDALDVDLDDSYPGTPAPRIPEQLSLGNICSLTVTNGNERRHYEFDNLDEVELSRGRWPFPDNGSIPQHEICRAWQGEDCSSLQDISETSEWHGLKWHQIFRQGNGEPVAPGSIVDLDLEVQLTRFPEVTCEEAADSQEDLPAMLSLKNLVRVRFGESPLPRFGDGWVYGDLHYHSQGTDNEGESGVSYRSVIRAMGAMGLDFALASEHASDSEQVIDADVRISVGLGSLLSVHRQGDTLRDMNQRRFRFNNDLVQGSGGANAEAALEGGGSLPANVRGYGVMPQLLLGGEIDAIPEVGPTEADQYITYGNGLRYHPSHHLCKGWHGELWVDNCDPADLWEPATGGVLIKDAQGLNQLRYGREHMVYLPRTGAPDFVNDEGGVESSFVSSQTSEYGGAQRRLAHDHDGHKALLPEVTRKGYAFLAHPLNAPRPGSEGPDGVPWSEHMLETAFRSEGILGLQIWNMNSRRRSSVHSSVNSGGGPAAQLGYERYEGLFGPKPYHTFRHGLLDGDFDFRPWNPETGEWDRHTKKRVEQSLQESTFMWDKMLLWGLDPTRKSQLPWLDPSEPRRIFMAGGSDAHGDLNYHRSGYFNGISSVTDAAIGSPRNLLGLGAGAGTTVSVEGGEATRYQHQEIVAGLASGNFTVTDGPALRIAVDLNGNGQIDESDVPMGGVLHRTQQQTDLPLLVEWKSTPEFGEVKRIDLYLGVQSGPLGRTYAPYRHGPRARKRGLGEGIEYRDAYGRKHELLDDNYWNLQEGAGTRLRISGPRIGPPTAMCDARVRLCTEGGFGNTDGGIPYTPLCRVVSHDVPCTECPSFELMEGYLSCHQTELLPPQHLPLPSPSFEGTRRLDLDLSAFEVHQNQRGEGFYVRAFARTKTPKVPFSSCFVAGGECNCDVVDGECIERFAFTNPIWVLLDAEPQCGPDDPDSDGDGIPDDCDRCPYTSDDICDVDG